MLGALQDRQGRRPRRPLCWGTIKLGRTSSPSPPCPPRVLPPRGPPPVRLHAAQTVLHGGNASSPHGWREKGRKGRTLPPQSATWMREGPRAAEGHPRRVEGVAQRESERGEEGRGELGGPDGGGRGGLRAPRLVTRISNPGLVARPVLVYFHFMFHRFKSGPQIQVHTSSPSFVPGSPRFGTKSIVPPPSLAPDPLPSFPTNHNPPPYFGETMSNPSPIPHLGNRLAAPPP